MQKHGGTLQEFDAIALITGTGRHLVCENMLQQLPKVVHPLQLSRN